MADPSKPDEPKRKSLARDALEKAKDKARQNLHENLDHLGMVEPKPEDPTFRKIADEMERQQRDVSAALGHALRTKLPKPQEPEKKASDRAPIKQDSSPSEKQKEDDAWKKIMESPDVQAMAKDYEEQRRATARILAATRPDPKPENPYSLASWIMHGDPDKPRRQESPQGLSAQHTSHAEWFWGGTAVLITILALVFWGLLFVAAWGFYFIWIYRAPWFAAMPRAKRRIIKGTLETGTGLALFLLWLYVPFPFKSDNHSNQQVSVASPTPAAGTSEPIADAPKPNIIPVSYGERHLNFEPSTQTFKTADTGIRALVAEFRNAHERGKEILEGKDIRAHIYFEPFDFYKKLDKNIPGFAHVEEGIWLNEKGAVVNFARGEAKTLVLVVEIEPNGFGGFDAFEHSVKRNPDGSEVFLPRVPKLTANKYVVKVEITGGTKGEIAELYHFTITLRPKLTISFG